MNTCNDEMYMKNGYNDYRLRPDVNQSLGKPGRSPPVAPAFPPIPQKDIEYLAAPTSKPLKDAKEKDAPLKINTLASFSFGGKCTYFNCKIFDILMNKQ